MNFLSFFYLSIPKRDLNTKKTPPNIEVSPERLRSYPWLKYLFRMVARWHLSRATSSGTSY